MYTLPEVKAGISYGFKWLGRFFLTRPIISVALVLLTALAIWKGVTLITDYRSQKRYEADRQQIVDQQPAIKQQSDAAKSDASAASVLNQERTNDIEQINRRITSLRAAIRETDANVRAAGSGSTDNNYRADLDELRRLCQRANAAGVQCDAGKLNN